MPTCHVCYQDKDLEAFPLLYNPKRPNQRAARCKACAAIYQKAYRLARQEKLKSSWMHYRKTHKVDISANKRLYDARNKDKIRAKKRAYRLAHREDSLTRDRVYHLSHKAQRSAYSRVYRLAHKDELRIKKQTYARNNRAVINTWQRAYKKKRPDTRAAEQARRRALKSGAPQNDLTLAQWREIQIAYHYRCVYCPTECPDCEQQQHKLTQDHIIPFSGGGSHTVSNVVPACLACNAKKGTGAPLVSVQPLLLTIAPPKKKRAG